MGSGILAEGWREGEGENAASQAQGIEMLQAFVDFYWEVGAGVLRAWAERGTVRLCSYFGRIPRAPPARCRKRNTADDVLHVREVGQLYGHQRYPLVFSSGSHQPLLSSCWFPVSYGDRKAVVFSQIWLFGVGFIIADKDDSCFGFGRESFLLLCAVPAVEVGHGHISSRK